MLGMPNRLLYISVWTKIGQLLHFLLDMLADCMCKHYIMLYMQPRVTSPWIVFSPLIVLKGFPWFVIIPPEISEPLHTTTLSLLHSVSISPEFLRLVCATCAQITNFTSWHSKFKQAAAIATPAILVALTLALATTVGGNTTYITLVQELTTSLKSLRM